MKKTKMTPEEKRWLPMWFMIAGVMMGRATMSDHPEEGFEKAMKLLEDVGVKLEEKHEKMQ